MIHIKPAWLALFYVLLSATSLAESKAIDLDVKDLLQPESWVVNDRKVIFMEDEQEHGIYFPAQAGTGIAWLKDVEFDNGVIEVDLKGQDLKGKSFIGIAFRGADDDTYEAIYFRPFNFNADNELGRSHSVQYIAEPLFPWQILRKEHPGKYENSLSVRVDPNDFFHVKIVLKKSQINVYVNNNSKACLSVKSLSAAKRGRIGLWVSGDSDGTFKNVEIKSIDSNR